LPRGLEIEGGTHLKASKGKKAERKNVCQIRAKNLRNEPSVLEPYHTIPDQTVTAFWASGASELYFPAIWSSGATTCWHVGMGTPWPSEQWG